MLKRLGAPLFRGTGGNSKHFPFIAVASTRGRGLKRGSGRPGCHRRDCRSSRGANCGASRPHAYRPLGRGLCLDPRWLIPCARAGRNGNFVLPGGHMCLRENLLHGCGAGFSQDFSQEKEAPPPGRFFQIPILSCVPGFKIFPGDPTPRGWNAQGNRDNKKPLCSPEQRGFTFVT